MRRAWRQAKLRLPVANTTLLVLGLTCILVAVIGTGLTVAQVSVPSPIVGWRQLAIGTFGGLLIALSLVVGVRLDHAGAPTSGFLGAPPPLSPRFVPRDKELSWLVSELRDGAIVALHGMGGAGKTQLAASAARNSRVHRTFRDGVMWLPVDKEPDLVALQATAARRLGLSRPEFTTFEEGRDALSGLLAERAVLIVLDNVWNRQPLEAFAGIGATVLFTTRYGSLARDIDAARLEVAELSLNQALRLLARWTNQTVDHLPAVADEICVRVDKLALGIAMIGAMLAQPGRSWEDVLQLLEQADLEQIRADFGEEYPHPNLLAAIQLSIDELPIDARHRYRQLVVFQGRGMFPRTAIETLWSELSGPAVGEILALLEGRSLLSYEGDDKFVVHDLLTEVIAKRLTGDDVRCAHERLLDGYRLGVTHWPNDGYFLQQYVWHLAQAGQVDELCGLLANIDWLYTKLTTTDLAGLLSDFSYSSHPVVKAIQSALHLSASLLSQDPEQLPGQLAGRLLAHPDRKVRDFVKSTKNWNRITWLRPLTPALITAIDDTQQRIMVGHAMSVNSVAISPDATMAASVGLDGATLVWRLGTGELLQTFRGNARSLSSSSAVAFSSDGRHVVSGDWECVRFWNVASGRLVDTFPHRRSIYREIFGGQLRNTTAVAITSDDRHVIYCDENGFIYAWDSNRDHLVRRSNSLAHGKVYSAISQDARMIVSSNAAAWIALWDVQTGDLRTSEHKTPNDVFAIAPNQRFLVSGGHGPMHIWDLTSLKITRVLEGGQDATAIALTSDSRSLVSGHSDGSIRVWNFVDGDVIQTLRGHHGQVNDLAITSDNDRLVSVGEDGTVRVWRLALNDHLDIAQHDSNHTDDFGNDALDGQTRALTRTVLKTDHRRLSSGRPGSVAAIAVNANRRRVISVDLNQGVHEWNMASGWWIASDDYTGRSPAVNPRGDLLAAIHHEDSAVKIWKLDGSGGGRRRGRILYPNQKPEGVVAVGDNGLVAISTYHEVARDTGDYRPEVGERRFVEVWYPPRQRLVRKFGFPAKSSNSLPVTALLISPKGLVVASQGEKLFAWSITTGEQLHEITDSYSVPVLATSSKGNILASVQKNDDTITVRNLDTGEFYYVLAGHQGPVRTVAISPDERFVVSGSDDHTIRVWDLSDGRELTRWTGDYGITACAIAPRSPLTIAVGDNAGGGYTLQLRARGVLSSNLQL
jgi:WD40 repeat protein